MSNRQQGVKINGKFYRWTSVTSGIPQETTAAATTVLEYASYIWSPHQLNSIKKVESVQRKFTKRLLGFIGLQN
jgi:hypothetical protein